MVFVESSIFTKYIHDYLTDDEYSALQFSLTNRPDAGKVVRGTGGLRKIRWGLKNKGKSGGARIIYYWQVSADRIFLLTLFAKNEMNDLTSEETKILKKMLKEMTDV
jgi:hypothetical protein